MAIRGGVKLSSSSNDMPLAALPRGGGSINSSLQLSTQLQHPGHYLYLSGLCAVERKKLYEKVKASLDTDEQSQDAAVQQLIKSSTWQHEVSVDHDTYIIDVSFFVL